MKTILSLILLIYVSTAFSQITLSGRVTDKDGEPLLGVNVYPAGTYDGSTTDIDGQFSFTTDTQDSLVLIASFVGFHQAEIPLEPRSQELNIVLKEEISQLNAVVITAGSFNASEENNREVLQPLDIVTTAGATADIPGALNTLPGTQAVGETGRLFVRGGDGRETKTFIDGMLVHNEYSPAAPNTPGRSRFSPFMFKGMSFSTGGYSAEYGQALSSALILNSKDVAENDRTDISLMSVGADVSTTQSFEKSSIAGKLQYSNLTPYFVLVSQRLKWDKAPEEFNSNLAYRLKTSKTGMLKLYSNLSRSRLELFEPDIVDPDTDLPVTVSNDYAYFNASYRELIGKKGGIRGGLSFTRSNDFTSLDVNSIDQDLTGYHAKLVADIQHSDRLALLVGGERIGRTIDQLLTDERGSLNQEFQETIHASFAEIDAYASSALAFKAGLRTGHNSLTGDWNLTPRLSTAYKTGENSQVSLAYGIFQQAPARQVLLSNPTASPERATHYIANYQWNKDRQSFRIEAYEKQYDQLTRYQNVLEPSTFRFDGDGYARGVDLFWRDGKTLKNTDYWVSYSYLHTKRNFRDFPGSFRPAFASTHNFSVVMKRFIEQIKSQFGLTYTYASERPFNDLNSDEFMGGRTPAYHDLSFNVSYLYSNQIIVHAMVNNVLGINNIFGYDFADEPDADGFYASRPVTQPARRFIFLGVFITLSKNKNISQLPNL